MNIVYFHTVIAIEDHSLLISPHRGLVHGSLLVRMSGVNGKGQNSCARSLQIANCESWLRPGSSDRLLWSWCRKFEFHKTRNFWFESLSLYIKDTVPCVSEL